MAAWDCALRQPALLFSKEKQKTKRKRRQIAAVLKKCKSRPHLAFGLHALRWFATGKVVGIGGGFGMSHRICHTGSYALAITIALSAGLFANAQGVSPSGQTPLYPGMKANPLDQGPTVVRPRPWPPLPPVVVPPPVIINAPTMVVPTPWTWTYQPFTLFRPNDSDASKTEKNAYTNASASSDKPLAATAYPGHESLLQGLLNVKPAEVSVSAAKLVNVRAKMSDKEIQTLIQSVNANRRVFQNAEQLTARLQEGGLLHAGDRVVGYAGGKVYAVVGSAR
jgi:hypothetical protein